MGGPDGAPFDAGLHRKLVWLTFFRIVSVTVLLGGTAVVSWQAGEDGARATSPLYGLVIGTYLASLASAIWLRRRRGLVALAHAQIVLDVAIAAAVVALTGWAESVFVFMFSLGIVIGAILLGRRGAVTAFGLALVTYFGLEAMVAPRLAAAPWALLWVHAGAFAATAALAGYLAEQLRRTGERLAEREHDLATITALHESIVQSVTSGLLTLDAGGSVTFLNRAGEQMTGLSARQVMGHTAARWFGAFRTDTARGETDLETPLGTLRIGYSTFPLMARAGHPLGTAVIFQDLTALRAMEDRLGRTERLADLGRLAAGLAHELRNPLASMMGSVELLTGAPLRDDDRRLLDIVLREGGRLAQLVTDFLAFARPVPPRREPVDLAAVATETLEAFTHDPVAAGVRLERSLAAAPVLGDPDQLRQVLWNLLINAAQALPAPGPGGAPACRIRVTCGPGPDGGAELEVEDDGPGIDPADRSRLFTPFFTTKPAGTGLGLATIHRIVDAHGGGVTVDSAPGRGARFTVHLPSPAGPSPTPAPLPAAVRAPGGGDPE
jgi:two-component system, NtrC family, sensor histidine kinase PilS